MGASTPRAPWRTFHLVLGALSAFLVVLATIAMLLLTFGALRPSVRQLAAPLVTNVQLVDSLDRLSPDAATSVLVQRNIQRRAHPPATHLPIPVPFLEALAVNLRSSLERPVVIERRSENEVLLWVQSARGDWLGIPTEPLRTLVAQFALVQPFAGGQGAAHDHVAQRRDRVAMQLAFAGRCFARVRGQQRVQRCRGGRLLGRFSAGGGLNLHAAVLVCKNEL